MKVFTITNNWIKAIDVIGQTDTDYEYTARNRVETIRGEDVYLTWYDARDALELNIKDEVRRLRLALYDAEDRLKDVKAWRPEA